MNWPARPCKPTKKIVALKRRRQSAPPSTNLRDTSLASLWSGCLTVQLTCQLCLLTAPKPHPLLSNLCPLHSSCPACGAVIGVSWVQCTRSHPASNRQTLQNSRCFVGVATTLWAGGSWLHLGHNKRGQDEGSGGRREEVWPRKTWESLLTLYPLCLSLPLSRPESCSERPI